MSLRFYTDSLSSGQQFQLAVRLTRLTLPIWNEYCNGNELTYTDSVVAMKHSVDEKLLKNTIDAVEKHLNTGSLERFIDGTSKGKLLELRKQFDDPIIALQDLDWELPEDVKNTFYAVYNLLDSSLGKEKTVFDDPTIYVSINQAADALITSKTFDVEQINDILNQKKKDRKSNASQ